MSEMPPPEPAPAPESQPKTSWLDRLLGFGNHNKVIAAATLVTLATGVPYLVMSAVGAFSGEDTVEARVQDALDEALAKALAEFQDKLVRYEAGAPGPAPVDAGDAEDALRGLEEEALRPGATREEQDQIIEAVIQYASGNSGPAIAQFERVAQEQEERGALADAARTLRRRGALRALEDEPAALSDYERAEALAAGGAADWVRIASLRSAIGDFGGATEAAQVAADLARREHDPAALTDALLLSFGGADTAAKRQAAIAAAEEASTLLRARLAAEPQDLVAFGNLVGARTGRASALLDSELQPESIRAEARGLVAHLDALDPYQVDAAELGEAYSSVYLFAVSYAVTDADGSVDAEVEAWARLALDEMEARLDALSGPGETKALQIAAAILTRAFPEDEARLRRSLALSQAAAERTLAYAPDSVDAAAALGLTMFTEVMTLVRMDDLDGAVEAFAGTIQMIGTAAVLADWRQETGVEALLHATFGRELAQAGDARAAGYLDRAEALAEAGGEGQGFAPVTRDNIAAGRAALAAGGAQGG